MATDPSAVIAELRRLYAAYDQACPMAMAPWDLVKALVTHADALLAIAEAASHLKAEALAVARTQVRGYGMQGKLAYLRKSAEDVDAALARLAPTTKETER